MLYGRDTQASAVYWGPQPGTDESPEPGFTPAIYLRVPGSATLNRA